ncbi:hypothetical protein GCM10022199_01310 [Marihabitans asiaticum]|uniref:CDP-4-dehydro-6-deoxyglucose reductase n=1 Tax=Marihabitans asiaticum TaxID=415218 RepID=A0A560WFX0_9MICO|nr:2Fe-2S iron-sulfur cluster-binding protein [Marihabitans asiaticum]TWD16591.1 CDP-4-dehydro-6-deoxyglucose reductase [Marihabitans asiaticum]
MPTLSIPALDEVVYLEPGETVLSGLYKAGFSYTVGCRRGGCGICKLDVIEGSFSYERPVADTVISTDERTDGTCLSCRAIPESNITIQMREYEVRLVNPLLRQINEKARLRAEALAAAPDTPTTPDAGAGDD